MLTLRSQSQPMSFDCAKTIISSDGLIKNGANKPLIWNWMSARFRSINKQHILICSSNVMSNRREIRCSITMQSRRASWCRPANVRRRRREEWEWKQIRAIKIFISSGAAHSASNKYLHWTLIIYARLFRNNERMMYGRASTWEFSSSLENTFFLFFSDGFVMMPCKHTHITQSIFRWNSTEWLEELSSRRRRRE